MAQGANSKNSVTENGRNDENSSGDFLVVGIGASAGGVGALKEFFAVVPADSGMAFVVILHLSQTHESSLAQILQSQTGMKFEQVTETVKVEPDNVYVIPPGKGLAMVDGHIELTEPTRVKGKRVPIDLFFRTLADAYGKNGVAVVLSGTGSDGTIGLKRVKENGGIGVAQSPDEAEYDAMPRSAINTGLVDLVLPVAEIPAKLIALRRTGEKIRLPEETDEISPAAENEAPVELNEILRIVRVQTGHDFSAYKHSTVLRRIGRRLQVHGFERTGEYLAFLREHADEAEILQRDLLISVTNFFREKEAFEALEREIVPKLFAGKTADETVRVWSVGCATGEEAYSVAMLLDEFAAHLIGAPRIQVFASDINDQALATGRECFYEETIVADVSPERLRRYFIQENGGYRVRQELREIVLFAPHSILRDPPFSKLDLIVCRNLLIYFNRETQGKVLEIFNFALRHDGFLFLGASESAENQSDLFFVTDKKHRIYQARRAPRFQPLPTPPAPGKWNVKVPQLPVEKDEKSAPPASYGEIHVRLVEQFAPPSLLVNEDYDIVHVSEHAGRYLRVTTGEPTRNLLKMIRPDLKLDLQSALLAAGGENEISESRDVRLTIDGREMLVNITARLIHAPEAAQGFYLVIFNESISETARAEAGQPAQAAAGRDALEEMVRRLEQELRFNRERLRATIEQSEISNEEHKAANEEFQAMNEELRSTSEELETGKEELQSVNEELTTLNHELKEKIEQVNFLNADLRNLIQSTDIGTIFLDRALRVKRYTPRLTDIFNIIPSDLGRPFEHVTHRLQAGHLVEDAAQVLKTLHLKETEVRSEEGDRRYLVRLAPYRTSEDKIDGVVMSFLDVTYLKRVEDELRRIAGFDEAVLSNMSDGLYTLDANGLVVSMNPAAGKLLGWTLAELRGRRMHDVTHYLRPDGSTFPAEECAGLQILRGGEAITNYEDVFIRRDGTFFEVSYSASPMRDENGRISGLIIVFQDITDRRKAARIQHEKEMLQRMIGAQEDERRRIARDLHDELGQQVTALRLKLDLARKMCEDDDLSAEIEEIERITGSIDKGVDFLAWELRPAALDQLGLIAALDDYVRQWSHHTGIPAELLASSLKKVRFASEVETNLYRIVQEALNNVHKHAKAKSVEVVLEGRGDLIVLIVQDNGRGFDPRNKKTRAKGIGLIGMRERAALIGGELEIESAPGKGTSIYVRVPASSIKTIGSDDE